MSDKKDQVKPLAPASHRLDIHDHSDAFSVELDSYNCRRRQRCIKLCGCSAAVLLITVTVILVLMFTVFHLEVPVSKMNAVDVKGVSELSSVGPGRNLTFDFDFSVRNRNAGSFKFSNTTTYLYYDGSLIGEAKGPAGEVRARKRAEMEASVGVAVDEIARVERLKRDLDVGMLTITSYTIISGRVKITREIKRDFDVKLNCTMDVNTVKQEIQDFKCS